MTVLGAVPYFLFKNFETNLLKYKLKSVLRNDCLAYDEEKLSLEEYFILPRPVLNPRSWNHNKMIDTVFSRQYLWLNKNRSFEFFEGI